MSSPNRTVIQWLIWYATGKKRPDIVEIEHEIIAEFEELYRESRLFSGAKFSAISFMFCFADELEEQIKLGRVGKTGVLSVDIVLDSAKWENLSRQQLKDHMRLAIMQAVVMAGARYKLPMGQFEAELAKLKSQLGVTS